MFNRQESNRSCYSGGGWRVGSSLLWLSMALVVVLAASNVSAIPLFIRGDIDNDGDVDIDDLCALECHFFLSCVQTGGDCELVAVNCLLALDVDDGGSVGVEDLAYLALFLAGEGPAPPEPFDRCSYDRTAPEAGDHCCFCCVGFSGNIVIDVDTCDQVTVEAVDVTDLTNLIDYLFVNFSPICCLDEGEMYPAFYGGTPDDIVDAGDLTALIDHMFISFDSLPPCAY